MTEIYKDIPGYEKSYQVSNLGNVRSLDRLNSIGAKIKGKPMIARWHNKGYKQVDLSKDGKANTFKVHVLVLLTLVGKRPEGLIIHHKNEDKTDNRLENLEYQTQRYNVSVSIKNSSSQYTGVCWSKQAKKWKAMIKIDGKKKHLGYFTDELEAAKSYQEALKKLNKK